METCVTRRVLAAVLVVGLQALSIPAGAAPASALSGSVVIGATEPVPLRGAIVHLADTESGAIVASTRTDDSGAFRAEGIAPASYRLGIESEGRLYAVASPLTLAPGQAQNVTVAIPGNAQTGAVPEDEESRKRAMSWWNNPLTASLIVVGGAVILGIIIDKATDKKDQTPVSPFTLQD